MPDIHVVPIGDLKAHDEMRGCWCHPLVEEYADAVVVVHHSLDGREYDDEDYLPEVMH